MQDKIQYLNKINNFIFKNNLKINNLHLLINVNDKKILINNKVYCCLYNSSNLQFLRYVNILINSCLFTSIRSEQNIDVINVNNDIQLNNEFYKIVEYCKLNKIDFYTGAQVFKKNKRSSLSRIGQGAPVLSSADKINLKGVVNKKFNGQPLFKNVIRFRQVYFNEFKK